MEHTELPEVDGSTKSEFDANAYATPLAVIIAAIMISGSILYSGGGTGASQRAAIGGSGDVAPSIVDTDGLEDDDPVLGNADAPVTIVEFSDFQCPFCRSFYTDTYQQIKETYVNSGKAKIVYRDFPLEFHSAARISAIAAECADEQGAFWEYHDKLFDEQAKSGNGTVSYGSPELKQWAGEVGLDTGQFNGCLDSEKYGEEVDNDFEDGQRAGVSGTPSFVINGRLIIGAQPFVTFEEAIESALQ